VRVAPSTLALTVRAPVAAPGAAQPTDPCVVNAPSVLGAWAASKPPPPLDVDPPELAEEPLDAPEAAEAVVASWAPLPPDPPALPPVAPAPPHAHKTTSAQDVLRIREILPPAALTAAAA
jgi:hypothetical protein